MSSRYYSLLCLIISGQMHAQTVQWAVRPTSAKIENYGQLLKVRKSGKCGLIDHNNREVVPSRYDSITSFQNGYALAMNVRGGQLKIEGVISEGDYDFQPLAEDVYATSYLWFSEGKMPVKGVDGWGYLGTDGNMVIPCQFQRAYPFSEGWASVMFREKNEDKAYYIDRNMNYLSVEAGYGDLVFASTFSGNEAVVYSRNMKGYVINRQGRKVRGYGVKATDVKTNKYDHSIGDKVQKFNEQVKQLKQDDRYEIYEERGKFGYKLGNKIVVPAQLEKAEPVRGDYANVRYKGQNGVLHIVEGDFSFVVENNQIEIGRGKSNKGYLQLSLPNAFEESAVNLRMKDEKGNDLMVQSNTNHGSNRIYSFIPSNFPERSCSSRCGVEVWSDDLLLWKDTCELSYNVIAEPTEEAVVEDTPAISIRPASFSLSAPKASSKRANPKNEFFVAVAVSNNGEARGETNVTLYIDGQSVGNKKISVRGQGSASAIFTIPNVTKERIVKAKAMLRNGRSSQESSIILKSFY